MSYDPDRFTCPICGADRSSMTMSYDPDRFTCPICGADRPDEPHLDWCDYDGPEPGEGA